MKISRRKFLGASAAAIVAGSMAQGRVFGANERIRVCTIGFHGQGRSHIKDILGMPDDAEIVALCDLVKSKAEERRQLESLLKEAFESVMIGGIEPQAALDKLRKDANAVLAEE